jgi:LPS O-antigen subunit length determinant protein (WzzB/FepE family)
MQKMNLEVLKIVYKKRRYILYSALIGLIASIVIALVITPKYKSSGVIYSSNLLSNRGILFSNDILSNNEATNTELLMQFINSNEIKNQLLTDFELDKHYGLDKNNPKFNTYYTYYYKDNFKFSQTKYESILIEVYDKDPEMAHKLAEGIIKITNQFIQKSVNYLIKEKISLLNNTLENRNKNADSLKLIIKNLSEKFGLFDYYLQIEQLSKSYYKNIPQKSINEFNPELKKISENGIDFLQLTEEFKGNILEAVKIKLAIDDEKAKIKSNINFVQEISKPELPTEKDSPKRTLLVIGLTLIFTFSSCLYIILKVKFQKIKDAIIQE